MTTHAARGIAEEAARIICEEQVTDYRQAKQKAAERLGLSARAALPDNATVQQAVLDYQRLFGGAEYAQRLRALRQTALRAMRLLAPFAPRLVGGAISGAVNGASRVQLHAFAEKPEELDVFLDERGLRFAQDERSYRWPDGSEERVPLATFEVEGLGVDVAVFGAEELSRPPVNPADGATFKRLDEAAAAALARQPIDVV